LVADFRNLKGSTLMLPFQETRLVMLTVGNRRVSPLALMTVSERDFQR
jgi:hypothetical protein